MEKDGLALTRHRSGFLARSLSLFSRLVIWYAIVTVVFRCPTSLEALDDSSPHICGPYIAAKLRATPYLTPYYNAYAAQYVDAARPYTDALYGEVYLPASTMIVGGYKKYAAPQISKARAYGEVEWERVMVPRIEALKNQAGEKYEVLLEPHVERISSAISPTLRLAGDIGQRQYYELLLPSYHKISPYFQIAYHRSQHFISHTGVPYTIWAYKGTVVFVRRRIWPPLRIVYGKNVEPQLSRIRERLASYRDTKELEAAVEEVGNPSTPEENEMASSTFLTAVTSDFPEGTVSVTSAEFTSTTAISPVPEPSANEGDGELVQELRRWQAKFSKAADKGSEDLAQRVVDITARQIESQVNGFGNALMVQLDEASKKGFRDLMSVILDQIRALPVVPTQQDGDAAYSSVLSALRSTGGSIKDSAQELRVWKVKYKQETQSLVQAAVDSTLDVIDGIRALGLQEIGLRWASRDDVTYQDWAEYHALKKSFDDWRIHVKSTAENHEGLREALQQAEDLENRGMEIAQDAAAELARLKDVAKWKINEQDASDDFDSRKLSDAAQRLGQQIRKKTAEAKEYVQSLTSTQGSIDSVVSVVSEAVGQAAPSASSMVTALMSSIVAEPIETEEAKEAAEPLKNADLLASKALTAIIEMVNKRKAEQTGESTDSQQTTTSDQPIASSIFSMAKEKAQSISLGATRENLDDPAQDADKPLETLLAANDPLASSVSANVESIISQAGRNAGPKASSVLSEIVSKSLLSAVSNAASPTPVSEFNEETEATIAFEATAEPYNINDPQTAVEFSEEISSEDRSEDTMDEEDTTNVVASTIFLESVASSKDSAIDQITEQAGRASEAVRAAAKEYESMAESAYGSASATVADTASLLKEDLVDQASSVSEAIRSRVQEAGEEFSTVTESLRPTQHNEDKETPESPDSDDRIPP